MPNWQVFYHLVWSTRNREPLLTPLLEKEVYGYLAGKVTGLGCVLHAVGGTVDHVHVIVAIPPAISVARFVGQIKGVSSARLNQSGTGDGYFRWQEEYSAFSFDAKRLPNFVAYVQEQKAHHAAQTTISILELTAASNFGPGLLRENSPPYTMDEAGW